ncbi:(Na+)-NQR maturation NqrM [Pleionea litopenaei]|uniref:(Na+)-NQR maturation NqrM n=1 Tax=Pleionea litopenaei TaxID=3070815 RepID=A0AA51RS23_9GAMM|nr:(Na+)-NQR maturation NqrM [Pleionea sp. HL-JVS1]WMS86495.1 (Na+)-NQR maturation NqrM [Pleionea sp. HL-JVS1]
MLSLFLITFGILMLVIVIMAVGYIFQRKTITGSCGGLTTLGIKKVCDCDEPCEKRKERDRKAAARNQLEIDIKQQ